MGACFITRKSVAGGVSKINKVAEIFLVIKYRLRNYIQRKHLMLKKTENILLFQQDSRKEEI